MATKKKRTDTYHHGDLRRALLDAARVELHKVGMQELSLRSVARRAGVTHTAAYHHFTDKDALLRRLAQEGFERLDASMHRSIAEAGAAADPVTRLRAAGHGYLRFAADDPAALQLMFEGLKPVFDDPALQQAGERAFTTLVECVAAARASAGLTGDPIPDAMLQWSTVHGFATLSRNDRLSFAGVTDVTALGDALLARLSEAYHKAPR